MLCPNCGRDTPNEPLCVNCGLPLRRTCPQCGQVATPDATACNRCGTQLGPAPPKSSSQFPGFFGGGRYVLQELLGEGGRKRVYLSHDTALDRDVALALIKTEDMDDAVKTRITSDVKSMGHLSSHENIVSVFNYGEQEEQLFLITELMVGGSLETLLEQSPDHRVPINQAIAIAKDVCTGLEFAHSHDITHLNLKPSHVLLAEDGTAAISDFGLALQGLQLTQGGLGVDAVSYLSPEQAQSDTDVILTFRNFGDISLYGADLNFTYYANRNWNFGGNYSYISKDFFENVDEISDIALNASKHKLGLSAQYLNPDLGLNTQLRLRYVDGFPVNSGVYVGEVDSYAVLDLNAGYDLPFFLNTRLSLTVQNLLDNKHQEFVGAPKIGRLSTVRLTQSF